jgi:hypothetical protein
MRGGMLHRLANRAHLVTIRILLLTVYLYTHIPIFMSLFFFLWAYTHRGHRACNAGGINVGSAVARGNHTDQGGIASGAAQ